MKSYSPTGNIMLASNTSEWAFIKEDESAEPSALQSRSNWTVEFHTPILEGLDSNL
jgi:hypothetical protein